MKSHKTLSVILMIILTTIVLNIASIANSKMRGVTVTSDPTRLFRTSLVQAGLIAALLCITVWMMLVWDAGDRVPPALMLVLGLLGLCPFLVYIADPTLPNHICIGIPFVSARGAAGPSKPPIPFPIS
jgi:hypothetical protein